MRQRQISRTKLMIVAEILNIYITQDEDGFVQIWDKKPKLNSKEGYWEIEGKDSVLLLPIIYKYTSNWKKSLITPSTKSILTYANSRS